MLLSICHREDVGAGNTVTFCQFLFISLEGLVFVSTSSPPLQLFLSGMPQLAAAQPVQLATCTYRTVCVWGGGRGGGGGGVAEDAQRWYEKFALNDLFLYLQ